MKSTFGERLRVTLSGESHGPAVSATVTGLPAGIPVDLGEMRRLLARRQGGGALTTARREPDEPEFLSGIAGGVTTGEPLTVQMANTDARSADYAGYGDTPRPSHADYTAKLRFGDGVDLRGGGHFSARLTAPLCAVGAICLGALAGAGISVGAHLEAVGRVQDRRFSPTGVTAEEFPPVKERELPVLDAGIIPAMKAEIEAAAKDADSVGGLIECAAVGLPAGLGSPLAGGLENRLSSALFVLGGVRGVEFGLGFAAAAMRGSRHNDPFILRDGRVLTASNNAGGILGGISDGMPLIFRVAMKPTASIGQEQDTVSLSRREPVRITVRGRHDPCIALRAVPCVEAVAGIVLYEALLEAGEERGKTDGT